MVRITLISNLLILLLCVFSMSCQKPGASSKSETPVGCDEFRLDLTDGTMNGVKPNLNQSEIKEWMPCYTRFVPDGSEGDCGGGVFYDRFHFAFYTYGYDYLEVRKEFKGPGSDTLFQKDRQEVRAMLGTPVQNEITASYPQMDFFTVDYGCIRVVYENNMPVIYGVHNGECENLDWCGKVD